MSDTPKVDSVARIFNDGDHIDWVQGLFARKLERDLAAAKAEIERLKAALRKIDGTMPDNWQAQIAAKALEECK